MLRTTSPGHPGFLIFVLTFSLVLALFAAPAAAEEKGEISGRVESAAGTPATDARIEILDLHRTVSVDDDATFTFDEVPPGRYLIQAVSVRYGTGLAEVEVGAGETAEVEIALELASQVDAIVVTGPDRRSRLELAQPVSVLAGEELSLRAQPTLGETLAQEPGVSSTYFAPGASRPVIRGLAGDRVRMLQDGLGLGDVSATSPDHAVGVEAASMERIEVVRGPATLLYGSSAVGGVVNVLDGRIPISRIDVPFSGSVEVRGGSVSDERTGSIRLDGGGGSWAWHVDAMSRDTGDFKVPDGALEPEDGEPGDRLENSDVETAGGAVGFSYFFPENRGFFGVSVNGFDSEYGLPIGHHGEEDEEEGEEHGEEEHGEEEEEDIRIDLEQRRVDLRAEIAPAGGFLDAVKIRFGATDYEHTELEGPVAGTSFFNEQWEGRFEFVMRERGRRSGSFGLQATSSDLEAVGEEAFIPPTETEDLAVFFFDQWDLDALSLELGGRYETREVTPRGELPARDFDGLSLSAGLVWTLDDAHSVAVSLARSSKLPNGEELYSDGVHTATQSFDLGNVDLGKETSLGLDIGLRRNEGRFTGELNVFVNRFDDYIFQAFSGGEVEGFPVLAYTQADAEFIGAEFEGRIDLWHAGESHIDLQFFADVVDAELRDTGEPLPRIPPLSYGAGFHVHNDRLHGLLELRRVEEQDDVAERETPTDGFTLLNASVSYRFYVGGKVYDVLLRGTNLTDEVARNHVSLLKEEVPLPGRDVSVALRFRF